MKRLTTDAPEGNFETMLNFVFGQDGWAHIRHDGDTENVPLTRWAKEQCLHRGCVDFLESTPEEIDEALCDCMMSFTACPIAFAYCFASQAVHLRSRLKLYEDILYAEDGTERVTLDELRELAQPAQPLTIEELRHVYGEPLWCGPYQWKICYGVSEFRGYPCLEVGESDYISLKWYGYYWSAYRRNPEVSAHE